MKTHFMRFKSEGMIEAELGSLARFETLKDPVVVVRRNLRGMYTGEVEQILHDASIYTALCMSREDAVFQKLASNDILNITSLDNFRDIVGLLVKCGLLYVDEGRIIYHWPEESTRMNSDFRNIFEFWIYCFNNIEIKYDVLYHD